MAKATKQKQEELLPELNIGLVGHVDHGKTTLTEALSGKFTDTHSEELKRGITIKLGYADATFYKGKDSKGNEVYSPTTKGIKDPIALRKVSFIDAPGHETLMATMLSGAAIMDAAILLVSATEACPQPQTREHLMALEISGIKDIIIVQNKIDLVTKEKALENYKQIKNFVKGTVAETVPIIPISAQHNINIDILIKTIQENFKTPERDLEDAPMFFVARSFDVNRPGEIPKNLKGGILGGAVKQGILKVGDKITIKPGFSYDDNGRITSEAIDTTILGLMKGGISVKEITPGGSCAIETCLDPSVVKSDSLVGNVVGYKESLPETRQKLKLNVHLLDRVVGTKEELKVEPIKKGEILVLNVNSSATVGMITEINKEGVDVNLKVPVCASKDDRVTISRKVGARWRLIGYSEVIS